MFLLEDYLGNVPKFVEEIIKSLNSQFRIVNLIHNKYIRKLLGQNQGNLIKILLLLLF
jgi:hypothetical protein